MARLVELQRLFIGENLSRIVVSLPRAPHDPLFMELRKCALLRRGRSVRGRRGGRGGILDSVDPRLARLPVDDAQLDVVLHTRDERDLCVVGAERADLAVEGVHMSLHHLAMGGL